MRIALIACVATGIVLLDGASAPALPPPVRTSGIYVVRPDPRLCPSPLCGGYWVSLANHARTRCHDGKFRPRCYVAIAISTSTREPLKAALPATSLVRAAIGTWTFGGVGDLGAVWVADAWAPVSRAPPSGDFYRVRDRGIRCIRAPCFSFRAHRLNTRSAVTVSELDLGSSGAMPRQLQLAHAALTTPDGLLTAGRVVRVKDGGRLFSASQVFLRVVQPRA
jgi:hypothetical protein